MATLSEAIRIVLPVQYTLAADQYRHLYAAVEAVRLKHNSRSGDMSAEAIGFRGECLRVQTALLGELLKLRPRIADPLFKPDPKALEVVEPNHPRLKSEGHADYRAADVKAITGVDLDASIKGEVPPDPTEDFTGFSEVDPGTILSYTAARLTFTAIPRNADVYAYKDYGASHFGATFLHNINSVVSSSYLGGYALCGLWLVSNVLDDMYAMDAADSQALCFLAARQDETTRQFGLRSFENSGADNTIGAFFTTGNTYYHQIERTGETALAARIYSDSGHTTLLDTLTVAPVNGRRFRYVMGGQSYNDGAANATITGYVENLDLNEGHVPYSLILQGAA